MLVLVVGSTETEREAHAFARIDLKSRDGGLSPSVADDERSSRS
jgi:hypothetical protein